MGWLPLAAAGAILISYLCTLSIYRIFFHPLSKYPGPILAVLSDWYTAFYAWRGDMHIQTRAWHNKYGNVVRYGPNSLSFSTHTSMNDIYGIRANVRKADSWVALSASRRTPNILSVIDKNVHSFKRRTLAPIFSDKGLKQLEERILLNIKNFTSLLGSSDGSQPVNEKNGWSSPKNMASTCDWLTFDVTSNLCYGESFNMLSSPLLRWVPLVFKKMSQRAMTCVIQTKVFEYKVDRVFLASYVKDIIQAGTWIYNRAKARAKMGNEVNEKDIFYALMNTNDRKMNLAYTQKDLWIESMLLLAAGADTTSTAMSAVFFYLLHRPETLSRLTSEIRTTFMHEDEIRMGSKLNSCEYLKACINEVIRLVPSVPNISPRKVLAGGITVDGEYLPEGTNLGASIYNLQRNEAYFQDPDVFRPERWILDPETGVNEESIAQAKKGFCPFGVGSRSCVGWKLAWMELNVVVARALFLYDIRMAPGAQCCEKRPTGASGHCDYEIKAWAVAAGEGPDVQFRRR